MFSNLSFVFKVVIFCDGCSHGPTTAGTKFIVTTTITSLTSRSHVHALNPMAGNFNGGLRCPSKDREAFEWEDNRWSRRRAAVRGPSHRQRYAIRDNRIRRTLGSLIVAAEDERSRSTEAVHKVYRAICLRWLFMILGFARFNFTLGELKRYTESSSAKHDECCNWWTTPVFISFIY